MSNMDGPTAAPDTEGCFALASSALTVDDVYEMAKVIGAEVEKLIDGFGRESAAGLVPKIVKVLELLESFASRNLREEELLKTFESLQLQQQKRRAAKESEESGDKREIKELQQKEQQWRRRCEELQLQVQQLQMDREELQNRLKGSHAQEGRVQRQEREVMLKLKEVVDKQRDELRAKVQQISTISKEAEALQEQLERFMKMNAELHHKHNALQAQLKSTVERKADMEADLKEKIKEIENLQAHLDKSKSSGRSSSSPPSLEQTSQESTKTPKVDQKDADQPCFTKKEVRDIIFERNELKTNLFLVQEELSYYQREIMNEDMCPSFLLRAVQSAIKKRKTVIKAKMLGIPLNECSSDDEEKSCLDESTEVDGPDKPAESSRIRNLFGFLTWSGSSQSPTHTNSSPSTWEVIDDSEAEAEEQQQRSSP